MTRFLIDTNLWMQELKGREGADAVRTFLQAAPAEQLFTTLYRVHSVGIILSRFRIIDRYEPFLRNVISAGKVGVISLSLEELARISTICNSCKLGFDDAYQYLAAELNNLRLVSLDSDFDHTPRGRLAPEAALKLFTEEK